MMFVIFSIDNKKCKELNLLNKFVEMLMIDCGLSLPLGLVKVVSN
jgi:hypothetical protein